MDCLSADIIGKYINVARYKELSDAIPDKKLKIVELVAPNEIEIVRNRYIPYLEGVKANPAAVTLGDEMIFIGSSVENKNYVYYVDIEFGVFKLHNSIEGFIDAVKL